MHSLRRCREAPAGADAGARIAAHQAACRGADCGADDRALHAAVRARFVGRAAVDVRARILPALVIVEAELVKAFPGAREDEDRRRVWRHARASNQKQNR